MPLSGTRPPAVVVEYDIHQRGMLFGNVLAANVNVSVGYWVRKSRSVLMVPNNSCLVAAVPGHSSQCSTVSLTWLHCLHEGSIVGSIRFLYAEKAMQWPDRSLASRTASFLVLIASLSLTREWLEYTAAILC